MCVEQGLEKSRLAELHCLVEHTGPFHEGDHLFREGDPFTAIAAVRSGTVKTCVIDTSGREQVLGFFLPGEIIGLNAIHSARYPCNAIALDTVLLCRFSFPAMPSRYARRALASSSALAASRVAAFPAPSASRAAMAARAPSFALA